MARTSKCTNSRYDFPESAIVTATERDFLHLHTPNAVLGMIKDGSYDSKLAEFLNTGDPPKPDAGGGYVLRELFAKDLTLSDVGKRKGLVVPKKDAEDYFPDVKTREGESMRLRFVHRRTMRWLEFKYCFYRSSQCYVFTTGWCRFVKDYCLKEKDMIKFYEFAREEDGERSERYVMIDVESFCDEKVPRSKEIITGKSPAKNVREELMVVRKRSRESRDDAGSGPGANVSRNELVVKEEGRFNLGKGVRLFGAVIG